MSNGKKPKDSHEISLQIIEWARSNPERARVINEYMIASSNLALADDDSWTDMQHEARETLYRWSGGIDRWECKPSDDVFVYGFVNVFPLTRDKQWLLSDKKAWIAEGYSEWADKAGRDEPVMRTLATPGRQVIVDSMDETHCFVSQRIEFKIPRRFITFDEPEFKRESLQYNTDSETE